jgi:hypothetical protein
VVPKRPLAVLLVVFILGFVPIVSTAGDLDAQDDGALSVWVVALGTRVSRIVPSLAPPFRTGLPSAQLFHDRAPPSR